VRDGDGEVTVLRANCPGIGDVAIKYMPAELAADSAELIYTETSANRELPASFLLLKQAAVRNSPQGTLMVSQYGGDSWQHLLDSGKIEESMLARVRMAGDMLACIGLALQEMHSAGRLHRDIKPGIAFDCATGASRLLDFMMEGQASAACAASDIWALCMVALQVMLRCLPTELDFEWYQYVQGEHARVNFLDALTD
jgi:serine/threonine protein kinase